MRISLFDWLMNTVLYDEDLGQAQFVANVNGTYQRVEVRGVDDPHELSEIVKYDLTKNSISSSDYVFLEERVDNYRLGLLNNIKKYYFNNKITFRELLNVKIECEKADNILYVSCSN